MRTLPSRESVYHPGERFVQEQAGEVSSAASVLGVIYATIPKRAFAFLRERAFIVIAAADADGALWCSPLGWEPGFMRASDERTLRIDALPLPEDPLAAVVQQTCSVGTLAIDFATHRRMRLNGTSHPHATGMEITPDQVYANCPKYIAARSIALSGVLSEARSVTRSRELDANARAVIAAADTFFIGSAFSGNVDASHRGGPAGFVEMLDNRTLRWPDYVGNSMFMTLGNIVQSPNVGLLFVDWSNGDTLQLTGHARIDWDPAAARRFAGAKRTVVFEITQSIFITAASPLRWSVSQPSRFNPQENVR